MSFEVPAGGCRRTGRAAAGRLAGRAAAAGCGKLWQAGQRRRPGDVAGPFGSSALLLPRPPAWPVGLWITVRQTVLDP
jgi:hypothetical protein